MSSSDSKKRTSTDETEAKLPKHTKFANSDDEDDGSPDPYKEESEESKKSTKVAVPDVKSANDWEHADLGGEDKKAKFLRLMGAAKSQKKTKDDVGSWL